MRYIDQIGNCLICNSKGVDLHHVKTRGSGGPDEPWNLLPLCRRHHHYIHATGLSTAAIAHKPLHAWLISNNWQLCPISHKWMHPNVNLTVLR